MTAYQTNYQETYSETQLKDLKERLQITHKARLSRLRPPNQMVIRCRNEDCLFRFEFSKVEKDKYVLKNSFSMHLPSCELDSEDLAFQRNRRNILDSQDRIVTLIQSRRPLNGILSPGKILEILTPQGQTPFIYRDVKSPETKRRLKKKFDNVVADAKRSVLGQSEPETPKSPNGSKFISEPLDPGQQYLLQTQVLDLLESPSILPFEHYGEGVDSSGFNF